MNILLVDDDQDSRGCVAEFLIELGHKVVEADNGQDALTLFLGGNFPMVLTDIKMPKMTGLQLLQAISVLPAGRDTAVVLFTGHGDMATAIEALRAGAYDYLLKPINVEELAILTERIAEHQLLRRENKNLRENLNIKQFPASMPGKLNGIGIFSDQMNALVKYAQKYHFDSSIPVLIEGETGTGKEIFARIIHYGEAEQQTTPFIDVNCAALNASLFESELFGYEAGAFTGGLTRGQKGKFDLAQGGSIFLDEVAEIPLDVQGKLLRVLQEREFYRVGGLKKIKFDARVICATNVDLEQKVAEGVFRKDLYYRLAVGQLKIPPLRQRIKEIIPLAEMFLMKFSQDKSKHFKSISREASRILRSYPWPGNVRELRNLMEWIVFMYDDIEVKMEHIGIIAQKISYSQPETSIDDSNSMLEDARADGKDEEYAKPYIPKFELPPEGLALEDFINQIVMNALTMKQGNKTETARYLGISRRSLYSRLEHLKESDFKVKLDSDGV